MSSPEDPDLAGNEVTPPEGDALGRLRARRRASLAADTAAAELSQPPVPDARAPEAQAPEPDVREAPDVPASEPEPPGEPAAAPAAAAAGRSARPGPGLAVIAAIVVVVLAAGALTATTLLLSRQDKKASDRAAARAARGPIVAAATAELKAALSYDYRHLSSDFAAAEGGLTPSFRADYVHDTRTDVAPAATKYHAVVSASVAAAGIVTNTGTSATLLAFIDQSSTNTQLSAPRLDRSRARVTMLRQHGKWLLNSITTV